MSWTAYLDSAWKLGALLGGVAGVVWAWLKWSATADLVTRDQFEAFKQRHAEEHEEMERALAEGSVRFARIETQLQHLPTREDIQRLSESLGRTSTNVEAMMRSMQGLQEQVTMLVRKGMKE